MGYSESIREYELSKADQRFSDVKLAAEWGYRDVERVDGSVLYVVIAFSGRRNKPDGHCHYSTPQRRDDYVSRWLDNLRRAKRYKEEKAAQRRAAKKAGHSVKVGDIFVCSWGYEQTNVDFYQVVRTTAASVVIREIGADREVDGFEQGTARPVKDRFIGDEKLKRVSWDIDSEGQPKNVGIKISSYSWAFPVEEGHVYRWTSYY